MKYLIYTPYSKALEENERCNVILRPTWIGTGTNNYDIPLKHPVEDKGALCVEERYQDLLFTKEQIENAVELDETWIIKTELFNKTVHCDKCNIDIAIKPFNNRFLAVCNCGEILYNEINLPE